MSDFEYYDKEPKKSGKGFLIAALVVVAVALAGVLVMQYVVPYFDNPEEGLNENEIMEATATPSLDEPASHSAVQTVLKEVTYVESGSIPDIVERVSPAVVGVTNYVETSGFGGFGTQAEKSEVPQGAGSGVIISDDGYIVTNNHVIEGGSRITVTLSTGEEVNAEVIGSDQYIDLALLKIDKKGLQYMTFGDSESSRAGELAIAIGYPLPESLLDGFSFSSVTVTAGILSAVGVDLNVDGIHFEMLQTDAPINPGNSGGALVDGTGQLIGINTMKTTYAGTNQFGQTISAEGIGYAIPSHVVEPIVRQLKDYGEVIRPFIGISGRIVSQANSEYYDIPQGMYIDELTKNGPAEKAGIEAGDIITHINGEEILTFEDLYSFIMSSEVGQKVTLTVYRAETEETFEFEVTLGSSIDY
jgi:serine protease Do